MKNVSIIKAMARNYDLNGAILKQSQYHCHQHENLGVAYSKKVTLSAMPTVIFRPITVEYQLMLVDNRVQGCEQLARSCYAASS